MKMCRGEPPFEKLDCLLFTHFHPDHFSPEMTMQIVGSRPVRALFFPEDEAEPVQELAYFLDEMSREMWEEKKNLIKQKGEAAGTTFNSSGNIAKLSIGEAETSKKFVVKVTSKENTSIYTSVTINVVDTRNWLNNQEMQDVLVPGATRKTWLEPENIKNSGIEYDPDDFEWHIETYQYIDGTKIKINNDNNLNDNYGVLNNNSEEKGEYGGGNYLSYHIDKTKHWKGEFNQTIAVTSGLNLYDKEYDLLIWVTLKSDPSIGSNIITLRCRPHN